MSTHKKLIEFGEEVEGYSVPVLNEREIRAAAGILFLLMFTSVVQVLFRGNFLPLKIVIIVFLTDLLIRVFLNPEFSPFLIMARFIVGGQTPEYVGAPQKKFAWKIGLALVSMMFVLVVLLNDYSIIVSATCCVCLSFLFFESAFGICLGCIVYSWFYPQRAQYCPGETCAVKKRQRERKSLWLSIFILLVFIAYVLAITLLLSLRLTA